MDQFERYMRLRGNAGGGFTPFTTHGTRKQVSASTRRPGNMTANHFPSCTRSQAKKFDDYWVALPPLIGSGRTKTHPDLQNIPIRIPKV